MTVDALATINPVTLGTLDNRCFKNVKDLERLGLRTRSEYLLATSNLLP